MANAFRCVSCAVGDAFAFALFVCSVMFSSPLALMIYDVPCRFLKGSSRAIQEMSKRVAEYFTVHRG